MLRDTDIVCFAGEDGFSSKAPEGLTLTRMPRHNHLHSRNSVKFRYVFN